MVVERNRAPIACGAVRVAFVTRRNLEAVPVERVNNPRGTVVVSTVEATAVDLVGYMHRAGGVDRMAGVLSEFGDEMDPKHLVLPLSVPGRPAADAVTVQCFARHATPLPLAFQPEAHRAGGRGVATRAGQASAPASTRATRSSDLKGSSAPRPGRDGRTGPRRCARASSP